jgi:hypothetical protein
MTPWAASAGRAVGAGLPGGPAFGPGTSRRFALLGGSWRGQTGLRCGPAIRYLAGGVRAGRRRGASLTRGGRTT